MDYVLKIGHHLLKLHNTPRESTYFDLSDVFVDHDSLLAFSLLA
jgi:hypothetical protein